MDPQTAETTEAPSPADLAEFTAGYDAAPPTETPDLAAEKPKEEPQVAQAPAEPAAPEYVQLTRQQFDDLQSRTSKSEEAATKLQQSLDKAFGKLGVVEQDLRSRATAPVAGEISDEDFAELKALDPDIARMVSEGLKSASKKLQLQVPEIDSAPIEALVEQRVSQRLEQVAIETGTRQLNRAHPGWQQLIQKPDGSLTPDFEAWFQKQDESLRADVLAFDAQATSEAIGKFKKHREDAAKAATRTNRLDEAVNPRGTGGPARGTSDKDEFYAGYEAG